MSRAAIRRAAFVAGVLLIVVIVVGGPLAQRRATADYSRTHQAVIATLAGYAALLHRGEPRAEAARDLRAAGAHVELRQGDIIVNVRRTLSDMPSCRAIAGQLHAGVDDRDRIDRWETPVTAECGATPGAKDAQ